MNRRELFALLAGGTAALVARSAKAEPMRKGMLRVRMGEWKGDLWYKLPQWHVAEVRDEGKVAVRMVWD